MKLVRFVAAADLIGSYIFVKVKKFHTDSIVRSDGISISRTYSVEKLILNKYNKKINPYLLMKILVTGSSGNVASKIAERVSKNASCVGVDLIPGKYTTFIGSITDKHFISKIIPDVDAIIHTAAYHAPHVGIISDKEFRNVNVEGTELLLDLALRYNVNRFVFTSTTSVYGCTTRPKTEAVWVTETLPPNPEDIYDLTKLEAEQLCMKASKSGMETVILRMSRCFPEPDNLQVFYRLYRGISARDVAEAHWFAVSSKISGLEIFNISAISPFQRSDTKTLFSNPWDVIERIFPGTTNIFDRMKWEKPTSIDRVYVVGKARKLLNFKPKDNFWEYLLSKINFLLK